MESSIPLTELPRWMKWLLNQRPDLAGIPITALIVPGTHDTATYGEGTSPTKLGRFNWQCQNLNIYQQAQIGVRYFDLRFLADDRDSAFPYWPHHGDAVRTGDLLAPALGGDISQTTIVGQITRFLAENPDEIIILSCDVQPADNIHWPRALCDALGGTGRLVESPDWATATDNPYPPVRAAVPTIGGVLKTTGRVILSGSVDLRMFSDHDERRLVERYVWQSPGAAIFSSLYDEPIWKSNQPVNIQTAIENWIHANDTAISHRAHFYNAQCQLTPSANNFWDVLKGLTDKSMSISPAKLAPGMNSYLREKVCTSDLWIKKASIMTIDFADAETCTAIVNMNLARFSGS
ncbi:PLC-like phosphodiesterase [Kockovaella imperatae]|uniref:PLC-like phosphodiesterase n=1 Tax=Kockovaella imperatae TaxID=4999 RepID=A0A1Y1UBV3_9TREE|nr:PLC-like phosphodiesterase [Kockovaella imperatae]ORX35521.1 PLC-like phosphodiesterase [Kockovaella imperatae]